MKDWSFATIRLWIMFGVLHGTISVKASAPLAVWNGNFNSNTNGEVVLENGCSLLINGNEVAKDGASLIIGESTGVYVDWVDTRTTFTVLLRCSDLPTVSEYSTIMSFWDKASNSDLVGVALRADGFVVGIWEASVWAGNIWPGAEVGTNVVGFSSNGVLAIRYDGGLGYHGNTVGGTTLYTVNPDDGTIAESYFDVNLKRASARFSGLTIGACKNSKSLAPLTGLEIYGIAVFGDYLSEDEIVEAGKNIFSESASALRVEKPQILPTSTVFDNTFQEVSIICDTEGVAIYYTTDGSDPKVNGHEYTKPFAIYKSCTVRAIAVKYDWKDSTETTTTFTRGESLSEAANFYGYTMETDSAAPWTVDAAVSHDGVSSVRSGAIGNNGMTYLMASVKKAGTVSFWWKAQCEEPDEEDGEDGYYDYGAFLVDDVVKARIAGNDTGWRFVSVEVPTGGKHVLRWEYRKDGATSYAPDCVWVDQVQWIPADGSGYTLTSPEPVPYSWLRQYNLGVASGDFETAANAASGKVQGGAATSVWEEFVAGTDPTNAQSVFTAKIEMLDGAPIVTWDPNLNTNGVVRTYKVYGSETLENGGVWQYPTNSLHRFFRVTVEMP